ncbi:MAG TPA: hypothetical protein VKU42_10460 [Candidatus Angelobacter sp.]|nr:hypothetical protein [Candidatus Angelobacter sp.]
MGVSDKHICEMADDHSLPAFHVGRPIRHGTQDHAGWLQKKKTANAAADSPESDKHQSVVPNEQQKYIGRKIFDKRESHFLESALAIEGPAN